MVHIRSGNLWLSAMVSCAHWVIFHNKSYLFTSNFLHIASLRSRTSLGQTFRPVRGLPRTSTDKTAQDLEGEAKKSIGSDAILEYDAKFLHLLSGENIYCSCPAAQSPRNRCKNAENSPDKVANLSDEVRSCIFAQEKKGRKFARQILHDLMGPRCN